MITSRFKTYISLIILALLLTSCTNKKVDLNYIKIPDSISIMSNMYNKKIQSLNKELSSIKSKDSKQSNDIMAQIQDYLNKESKVVEDKDFIKKLIDGIKNSKDIVYDIKTGTGSELSFTIESIYNNLPVNIQILKKGYISDINIFEDGSVVFLAYDETSKTKTVIIKVNISKPLLNYIKSYYNSMKPQSQIRSDSGLNLFKSDVDVKVEAR